MEKSEGVLGFKGGRLSMERGEKIGGRSMVLVKRKKKKEL